MHMSDRYAKLSWTNYKILAAAGYKNYHSANFTVLLYFFVILCSSAYISMSLPNFNWFPQPSDNKRKNANSLMLYIAGMPRHYQSTRIRLVEWPLLQRAFQYGLEIDFGEINLFAWALEYRPWSILIMGISITIVRWFPASWIAGHAWPNPQDSSHCAVWTVSVRTWSKSGFINWLAEHQQTHIRRIQLDEPHIRIVSINNCRVISIVLDHK